MKWNRSTVKAVVIVFLTIIVTSFFIRWTFEHDGETITLFGTGRMVGTHEQTSFAPIPGRHA